MPGHRIETKMVKLRSHIPVESSPSKLCTNAHRHFNWHFNIALKAFNDYLDERREIRRTNKIHPRNVGAGLSRHTAVSANQSSLFTSVKALTKSFNREYEGRKGKTGLSGRARPTATQTQRHFFAVYPQSVRKNVREKCQEWRHFEDPDQRAVLLFL